MPSEEEYRGIEEAERSATPGPWEPHVVTCCSLHYDHPGGGQHTNVTRSWATGPLSRSRHKANLDADFIAGSRTWVPQLLETIRELKEEREILLADLEYWRNQCVGKEDK